MRTWHYAYHDEHGNHVEVKMTDDEVLALYWDYWCKRLTRIGKAHLIADKEACIQDWAVVHWATASPPAEASR